MTTALCELPQHVIDILTAGIHAPSGDNCQPWAFRVKGNRIDLYLRPEVDQSFFNFKQAASVISCGSVLENMQIKAADLGFQLEYEIDNTFDFSRPIVNIQSEKLKKVAPEQIELAHAIFKRYTNRKVYKRKTIPSAYLELLEREATSIPGCKLCLFTDRKDIFKWARLVYMADRLRNERRDLHEHLIDMIRWTEEESLARRDGLPLKNLEAGLAGELFLKATKSWKVMSFCNVTGLSRLIAFHSFRLMLFSSAIGIILIPQMNLTDVLQGGRAIERVWLRINNMGMSAQPMTAITLFLIRWHEQRADFVNKHQKILAKIANTVEGYFPGLDGVPLFLFRIGYADRIKHPTFRFDLGHFLC